MAWQTPKTNWQAADVVSKDDFNRIEGNAQHLKDTKADKTEFNLHVNNKNNPHNVTAAQVGAATPTQLATKVDKPSSATSGNIAVFDGGPGKVKDSGVSSTSILTQTSDVYVTGTYTGQWAFQEVGTRTITLGFRPKAVLIIPNNSNLKGTTSPYSINGGLMLDGYPLVYKSGTFSFTVAEIISTGFRLYGEDEKGCSSVNYANSNYRYIAFK